MVDALKRTCVGKLPHTLILQLKRFEFDLETMNKLKLNCFQSFPPLLDLQPFTADGVAVAEGRQPTSTAPSAAYRLVGVLVHAGSSEYGHYYSLIRERTPGRRFLRLPH